MATRVAVKEETEPTPRLIWDEVNNEMNTLETCQLAVESIETDHGAGDTHTPVSSVFMYSFDRLKDLLTEIMENYEEVKRVIEVPGKAELELATMLREKVKGLEEGKIKVEDLKEEKVTVTV